MMSLAWCGLMALSTAAPSADRRSVNNNVNDEFESIDGFPNPSDQQLADIEQQAHGTLSNSTPPASVSSDTILSLQVIAGQEQFESAFFEQLLTNVTNSEPGFEIDDANERKVAINALTAIVAVSAEYPCIPIYIYPRVPRYFKVEDNEEILTHFNSKNNFTPLTPSLLSSTSTRPP